MFTRRGMNGRTQYPAGKGNSLRLRAQNAALLLLLVVSGALAWDAYAEHRSFNEHARRSAQEMAGEAAGSLIRLTQTVELMVLYRSLAPISAHLEDDTPEARARFERLAAHPASTQSCAEGELSCAPGPAQYVFHLDFRSHAWTSTKPVSPAVRRWIQDSVTYEATHVYSSGWEFAALDARINDAAHVVVYRVAFDAHGTAAAANGLELDIPLAARQAFKQAVELTPLLTTQVVQGVPNDSLYVIDVVSSDGRSLFHSGIGRQTSDAVTIPTPRTWDFGAYYVRLSLTPRFHAVLSSALGHPRTIATTYVLFALCVGLIAFAIAQSRREYALARLRESFIANVSHELRTPLAQIRIYADALQLGYVRGAENRTKALGIIAGESVRLTHLVENVLTYTHDHRKIQLPAAPVDVKRVLAAVLQRLQPLALRANVTIDLHIDGAPVAMGDCTAIEQIITNIVDNAIRYAAGTETILVRAARSGKTVHIAVEDHGPGITPGDRERIWERFVRLDDAADVPGTGIGLSIVASLTAAMGGRATITDTKPRGATFIVEIPAA